MAETGVCRSIYDLKFQLGFVADRVCWAVNGYDGEKRVEDAAMTLVLDTMSAALEGPNGEHSTFMNHQVGELELETTVETTLADEDDVCIAHRLAMDSQHRSSCASQAEAMRGLLITFMSTYPSLLEADKSPLGKITAYMQRKQTLAACSGRANAIDRLANMSEVQYERLMECFKTKCKL